MTSSSYVDTSTLLAEDFSPVAYANDLVLRTAAPNDESIDLSTPLSRVLFDIQEIDTRIHTQATASALPLLEHTQKQSSAAETVIEDVDTRVKSLTEGHERLEKDVVRRWKEADEVKTVVTRLWETVRLGQEVVRCLQSARQLEAELGELQLPISGTGGTSSTSATKLPHRVLPTAAQTMTFIRTLLTSTQPGKEAEGLRSVPLIKELQSHFLFPAQSALQSRSQQIIREFSLSSAPPSQATANNASTSLPSTSSSPTTQQTYAQITETKARTTSAVLALYTLDPSLLIASLQNYLKAAHTSSLAAFGRALTNLSTLDRTLLEISARCQNIVALEALLSTILLSSPTSSSAPEEQDDQALRKKVPASMPLLQSLDTPSLPSYFWRTLASGLSPRVADLVSKGGPTARSLKANKDAIRDRVRECVIRGSRAPDGGDKAKGGAWDREAAVMVGSVVGALGR